MQRVNFLLNLLYHFKSLTIAILSHLGLLKLLNPTHHHHDLSSPNNSESELEQTCPTNYLLLIEGPSPFLVPVPFSLLIAHIKRKLPVSQLDKLRRGSGKSSSGCDANCPICLDCLDGGHEVRELLHCDHVFHKECLDCWVDQCQVTCPLCRSMLFSAKGIEVLREIHRV